MHANEIHEGSILFLPWASDSKVGKISQHYFCASSPVLAGGRNCPMRTCASSPALCRMGGRMNFSAFFPTTLSLVPLSDMGSTDFSCFLFSSYQACLGGSGTTGYHFLLAPMVLRGFVRKQNNFELLISFSTLLLQSPLLEVLSAAWI